MVGSSSLLRKSSPPRQAPNGAPATSPAEPDAFWATPADAELTALQTSPQGLTAAEAAARLASVSPLGTQRPPRASSVLLRQFTSPITLILIGATIVSALLGDTTDAVTILVIVVFSGLLGFRQEYSSSQAVAQLLASVQVSCEVLRDGAIASVPVDQVVPGDIVSLAIGDLVPGDCRILEANGLVVDESSLTGESLPVDKAPGLLAADTPLARRTNCLFLGTHIVRGAGKAVVVAAGTATQFGRVSKGVANRRPATGFEQGLSRFGAMLFRIMVVIVVVIFVANVLLGRPWIDSVLFSVALAVGLTPQLMPAIVSVSLAVGARQMAQAKVIVKRLNAIEDFGQMDVLCSDKTGTLTVGTVEFAGAFDPSGAASPTVLHAALANARYQAGYRNPIDDAIVAATPAPGPDPDVRCLGEVPYDFERKRLSVLVAEGGTRTLIAKGAIEQILGICSGVLAADGTQAPVAGAQEAIRRQFAAMSAEGLRVLGVATRTMPTDAPPTAADEREMTFLGFVALRDPIKPGIVETIRDLRDAGISLKIVTGDNRYVAASVARAVGLDTRNVVIGSDLDGLDATRLGQVADGAEVFAETSPDQKEAIIHALRQAGRSVGYLGDGVNDAPSLHMADVGISVDSGADIAKSSASIILLEKDLSVLVDGVRMGRKTFANTFKYISLTVSASFGNMISMAGATVVLPFLPLLPLQILLINVLSDLPCMAIATDKVDPEMIRRPERWDLGFVKRFMVLFGPLSSVFDVATFSLLRLGWHASPDLFRSGWFLESVLVELAMIFVLRTRRLAFRSRPSALLAASALVVAAFSLLLPYTPLGGVFGVESLPAGLLAMLAVVVAVAVAANELAKRIFYRWDGVRDGQNAQEATPTPTPSA